MLISNTNISGTDNLIKPNIQNFNDRNNNLNIFI